MKVIIISAFVLFITSCNPQKVDKQKQPELNLSAFYSTYGLTEEKPDLTVLQNTLSGHIYSQVKNDLDFTNVKLFSTGNSLVYIIGLKQAEKFYAFKFVKGIVSDELLYSRKMTNDKNGTFGILKNGEALTVEFKDGKRVTKQMTESEYKADFAKVDTAGGFCQRQPGQSFGDCYNHEVNEFCDSFFSCLAINTQPQIHIIIGIACSCNA